MFGAQRVPKRAGLELFSITGHSVWSDPFPPTWNRMWDMQSETFPQGTVLQSLLIAGHNIDHKCIPLYKIPILVPLYYILLFVPLYKGVLI